MRVLAPLSLLLCLLSSAAAIQRPSWCASRCRFSFCPNSWGYYTVLGTPDVPFTNALCDPSSRPRQYVGIVGRTGEASVLTGGDGRGGGPGVARVPISRWRPEGLQVPFADSFFKSFIVGGGFPHSGVGRQIAQGNQLGFLNRTCFELPVVDYQKLSWDGEMVLDNFNVKPGTEETDCVAFMTSL